MEENSAQSSENQPKKRVYPKWMCPICGTKTWITNKQRHLQTQKHKDVVYISTERFEMKR